MAKLTGLLIGAVLVSLIVAIMMNFIADPNSNFNDEQYDNSTFAVYNQLSNLSEQSNTIKNASDFTVTNNPLDIIGTFFSSGYDAVKTAKDSYTVLEAMQEGAIEKSGLGNNAHLISAAITTIIVIVIFLGILVSTVVKREL